MADTTNTWSLQTLVDIDAHISHEAEPVGTLALVTSMGVDAFLDDTAIVLACLTLVFINTLSFIFVDDEPFRTHAFVTTGRILTTSWTFRCSVRTFVLVYALLGIHSEFISFIAHAPEAFLRLHTLAVFAYTHHVAARILRFHNTAAELFS